MVVPKIAEISKTLYGNHVNINALWNFHGYRKHKWCHIEKTVCFEGR